MDIAVFGNINLDVIALTEREKKSSEERRIVDYQISLGGTATNTAVHFKRLQNNVFLNGAVGNDTFGNILMEKIKKTGVSTKNIETIDKEKTGFCFVTVHDDTGHRFLQTFRGANELFKPNKDNWRFLNHFAGMNTFQIKAIATFINPSLINTYTPGGIVSFENPAEVIDLSEKFDVIFFNEKEWENVRHYGNVRSDIVVVTKGNNGAEIIGGPEHGRYDVAPKDTTGAGDAFCAGFLHLYARKAPLIDCLALGNVMGGITVKEYGAQGIFEINDIISFLKINEPELLKYLEGAEKQPPGYNQ
ncbi:MAG: PfkB family carbohydrate kinase [Kosmotogaceae bacterium]